MNPSDSIDLVGLAWPFCLLEYQRIVSALEPGEVITVRVEDPDVAAAIRLMARGQDDRILSERRQGRRLHLNIRKHDPEREHPPGAG